MTTHRHIACAALLSLFSLHPSLFSQQAEPDRDYQAAGATIGSRLQTTGTTGAPLTTADVTSTTGAAAPTVNREPGTVNSGTASGGADDIVQMSPFQVNSSADRGYQAINTASGSRLNTPLKDTAAAISPFTTEFLNDIGAATVDDMLAYGGNIETGGGADFGFNTDPGGAGTTDNTARIRGMSMTTAMDGVETSYSMDTYNTSRAEISSGPNSILFGVGQPGGMVTLASKTANLQRNHTTISNQLGTWFNVGKRWDYYRATIDYNLVLMPNILGFRLNAMYQDGSNASWRYWMKSRDKRISPTIGFKPWKNTTVNIGYEAGRTKANLSTAWNASDRLTGWLNAGRPIMETFPTTAGGYMTDPNVINPFTGQPARITTQISNATTPTYTFDTDNSTMYDLRMAQQSLGYILNLAGNSDVQQVRLDPSISPYGYSVVGPGGWRDQRFDNFHVTIDQRIGDVSLQFGYFHNKNNGISHAPPNYDVALRGDPNRFISTIDYANGGAGAVLNPNAGRLYAEDNWEMRTKMTRNDAYRLTAEYSLNLQKWGRHRIVANLERTENEVYNTRAAELLIDQNGRPIANPTLSNATNQVIRRHYVTEGDFTTYYDSDWSVPIQPFSFNGNEYHSQYVVTTGTNPNANGNNHAIRTINSAGATVVSYFFDDKLVTTIGGRIDDTVRTRELKSIIDPNDPRITAGTKAIGEVVQDGRWQTGKHKNPFTYTAGAVWHATNRLSLFANTSTNRSADDPNGNTILPNGDDRPVSIGTTTEYGVMFDPLGNNKVFLRLTHFDTKQLNQVAATNQPNLNHIANVLLPSIYQALYDDHLIPANDPPAFTTALTDAYSRGYEAELTANITKAFTMRLTMSYTDRARVNSFKEVFAYFNDKIPQWMGLADPDRNGGNEYFSNGTTLYRYLLQQLYGVGSADSAGSGTGASIRDDLSTVLLQQSGGMGARPFKFNITAKYSFQQGWLKGVSVQGAVRYYCPDRSPDPARTWLSNVGVQPDDHPNSIMLDPTVFEDYATMIKGSSLIFWDTMVNYKRKVFGGRSTMTLQLNIKNIFNSSIVTSGQSRAVPGTGYIYLRRIYLNDPRSIRLTATFDF